MAFFVLFRLSLDARVLTRTVHCVETRATHSTWQLYGVLLVHRHVHVAFVAVRHLVGHSSVRLAGQLPEQVRLEKAAVVGLHSRRLACTSLFVSLSHV